MADIVRYVNTASTAGGDGTTNATSGANRAYATLAAWETAEQTDLVAAGNTHTVYCSGGQDTSRCELVGWTTGPSNRITIAANAGQEHGGVWNTGVYYLSPSTTYNGALEPSAGALYITVQGLQIENRGSAADQSEAFFIDATLDTTSSDVRVLNCILKVSGAGAAGNKAVRSRSDVNIIVANCLLLGLGASTTGIELSYSTIAVTYALYNNTAANWGTGFYGSGGSSGTFRAFNNIATNCTTDFDQFAGFTSGGNCSEDATSPQTGLRNRTFTFVNAGAGDYHLDPSDTGAIGQATDMSADGTYAFSTDIDGETRTNWDSGADEYVAGGGGGDPYPWSLDAQIIRRIGA